MKELHFVSEADQTISGMEEPEDNFLDIVFGLGELTELCGLNGTGKT
jgi:hypothetical protein